jgi:hypothetical protein
MIAAHIEPLFDRNRRCHGDRAHQLVSRVAESLSRVPMLRKGPLSLLHWNTLGIKNRITSG